MKTTATKRREIRLEVEEEKLARLPEMFTTPIELPDELEAALDLRIAQHDLGDPLTVTIDGKLARRLRLLSIDLDVWVEEPERLVRNLLEITEAMLDPDRGEAYRKEIAEHVHMEHASELQPHFLNGMDKR